MTKEELDTIVDDAIKGARHFDDYYLLSRKEIQSLVDMAVVAGEMREMKRQMERLEPRAGVRVAG